MRGVVERSGDISARHQSARLHGADVEQTCFLCGPSIPAAT